MIRLGLYGCGNRTKALLDSLINDEFYKVQAAYDLQSGSAEQLVAEYGGIVCRSADELLECRDVDAFLISLSPFAHASALRQTIPAGKPVFIEKPVAFSAREIQDLADLADRCHVPVQVGFMRRYLPETLTVLDYIRSHDPGRFYNLNCHFFHQGDMEMNYNLVHRPDNFRLKVSQIPFHSCHALDVLMLVGGAVEKVSTQLIKVTDRPYPSPDDVIASLSFANGANGYFHYSSMVYYGELSYRFNADNYSIRLNAGDDNVEIYQRPRFRTSQLGVHPKDNPEFYQFISSYQTFCRPECIRFSMNTLSVANENIMYDFVRMVRDHVAPESNLRAAVRVQGLAEGIELSGRLNCPVEFTAEGIPVIPGDGQED